MEHLGACMRWLRLLKYQTIQFSSLCDGILSPTVEPTAVDCQPCSASSVRCSCSAFGPRVLCVEQSATPQDGLAVALRLKEVNQHAHGHGAHRLEHTGPSTARGVHKDAETATSVGVGGALLLLQLLTSCLSIWKIFEFPSMHRSSMGCRCLRLSLFSSCTSTILFE